MQKIVNRLREPSTWAGFAILASMFGGNIDPASFQAIGGGVMAALSIVMPEAKP